MPGEPLLAMVDAMEGGEIEMAGRGIIKGKCLQGWELFVLSKLK